MRAQRSVMGSRGCLLGAEGVATRKHRDVVTFCPYTMKSLFLAQPTVTPSESALPISGIFPGGGTRALSGSVRPWGQRAVEPTRSSLWEPELSCKHSMVRTESLWWPLPGDTFWIPRATAGRSPLRTCLFAASPGWEMPPPLQAVPRFA